MRWFSMHKLMRYIKGYEKQAVLAPLFSAAFQDAGSLF